MSVISKPGFGCNNFGSGQVSNINGLNGDAFHTDAPHAHSYWKDPPDGISTNYTYVIKLFDTVPTAEEMDAVLATNYLYPPKRIWIVGGNEPCGQNRTFSGNPGTTFSLVKAQIDAVKAKDANATFALQAGCQYHSPGNPMQPTPYPVWVDAVLDVMLNYANQEIYPPHHNYIDDLEFVVLHWYPQADLSLNSSQWLNKGAIKANFDRWNTWRNSGGTGYSYFGRVVKLMVGEIGLVHDQAVPPNGVTYSHADIPYYPQRVQEACNERDVNWWFWHQYQEYTKDGTTFLGMFQGSSTKTALGDAFDSIVKDP